MILCNRCTKEAGHPVLSVKAFYPDGRDYILVDFTPAPPVDLCDQCILDLRDTVTKFLHEKTAFCNVTEVPPPVA